MQEIKDDYEDNEDEYAAIENAKQNYIIESDSDSEVLKKKRKRHDSEDENEFENNNNIDSLKNEKNNEELTQNKEIDEDELLIPEVDEDGDLIINENINNKNQANRTGLMAISQYKKRK